MTAPTAPTHSASGHAWSALTSSPVSNTPTRLTSTLSNASVGAGGRGNPLSLRLYKILGARYEDESTHEALEILSGMYAPIAVEAPPSAGPAAAGAAAGKPMVVVGARRSGKARGGDADAESDASEDGTVVSAPRTGIVKPTPTAAVTTDGAGGSDLAAQARKNLKRDVDMKMARSSRLFLSAFREVDKV